MTEKRFELKVNQHNQCDIVDLVESKEKNAICIYNDLGSYYFSSAKALCELLNELHEENQLLLKASEKDSELIKTLRKSIHQWRKENEWLKERIKELK